MTILFIIGIILTRNILGKSHRQVISNNCSQAYFDDAAHNYMASFQFISENIDGSCPNAKAIVFKKSNLLEVDMELRIAETIWTTLNKTYRLHLKYELRNRLHFSCNSISLTKELCRSEYSLDGGVFISVYDGSLASHPFQKSCSICLLRSATERLDLRHNEDFSPVLSHLNLSLIDIINRNDSQSEDVVSVKLVRSRTDREKNSDQLFRVVFGSSFPNQFMLLSDSVTYNIKVRLMPVVASPITSRKDHDNSSECIFRCDWSSKCLSSVNSICDNIVDCRHGDDENALICHLYNRLKHTKNSNSSVHKLFNYNDVNHKVNQHEDFLKLIIPVLFAAFLIAAGIGIISFYFHYKRRKSITKTMCNISNVEFSKVDKNSIYLQKPSTGDFIEHPFVNGKIVDCSQDRNIISKFCSDAIHHKFKNNHPRRFIHPKSFRKPERSNKYLVEQYNGLCGQINYPDTKTRSNWLRTYFQLSRTNSYTNNKPPVLNISHFPQASFTYKQ